MATLTTAWSLASTNEDLRRSSHSLASVDGETYVFGGELAPRQPRDNDVFKIRYNLDAAEIETMHVEDAETKPVARVGATMTAIGDDLYIFSGRGGVAMAPIDEQGALQVFHTKTAKWSTIKPADASAPVPEPRSYHCATTDGRSIIYIHAGCPEKGRLRDLWSFDITSRVWKQLEHAPMAPRGGTSIACADGKLYRMNGFDGKAEIGGSLDVYDIAADWWTTIEYAADGKTGPGGRSVSSLLATTVGEKTYLVTMFGEADPSSLGHAGAGKMLDDAWAFDVQSSKWHKLEFPGDMPQPRGWFDASVVAAGKIAVCGGLADSNKRLADAWMLTIQ